MYVCVCNELIEETSTHFCHASLLAMATSSDLIRKCRLIMEL